MNYLSGQKLSILLSLCIMTGALMLWHTAPWQTIETGEADASRTINETSDAIALPPTVQRFETDNHRLEITATDQWQTTAVTARLWQKATNRLRWEVSLPHEYGPRYVLLSETGYVLLIDEYINIASDQALALINLDGHTVRTVSFEEIATAIDIPTSDLVRSASSGWWVSAPPTLDDSGNHALIGAGPTTLAVNLSTGELSVPSRQSQDSSP